MAAYWPTPAAEEDDPRVAARMNNISKLVVSRTLDRAEWANTRVIKGAEELTILKQQPGKDIAILGSSDLTVSLLQMGWSNEVRIMLNPGRPRRRRVRVRTAGKRISLKLLKTRPFNSGNVLLYYSPLPARQPPKDPDPLLPGVM
jgi:dihydrofolate reductase